MLSSVVAGELRDSVRPFLPSAFPIATPYFQRAELAAQRARGSIDWLGGLLREPAAAGGSFIQRALFRGMSSLVPRAVKDDAVRNKLVYEASENAPSRVCGTLSIDDPEQIPGGFIDALGNSVKELEMIVALPTAAMRVPSVGALAASICVHLSFDDRSTELNDECKGQWRAFWYSANQLQFLPRSSMASRVAVAGGDLDRLWAAHDVVAARPSDEDLAGENWSEVFELATFARDQLRELASLNLPWPEVGVDLRNEDGAGLGRW